MLIELWELMMHMFKQIYMNLNTIFDINVEMKHY